jgi:hypothetical protein
VTALLDHGKPVTGPPAALVIEQEPGEGRRRDDAEPPPLQFSDPEPAKPETPKPKP